MSNTFEPTAAVVIMVSNPVDIYGISTVSALQPTGFIGTPLWQSSDPAVLPLVVATNGLSATGTSLKAGTVVITVTSGSVAKTESIAFASSGTVASFTISVTQLSAPPPPPPNP